MSIYLLFRLCLACSIFHAAASSSHLGSCGYVIEILDPEEPQSHLQQDIENLEDALWEVGLEEALEALGDMYDWTMLWFRVNTS